MKTNQEITAIANDNLSAQQIMKEVIFKFDDGSEYTIRPGKEGDTIFGEKAHDIMFRMMRHFNYANVHEKLRIEFILNEIRTES